MATNKRTMGRSCWQVVQILVALRGHRRRALLPCKSNGGQPATTSHPLPKALPLVAFLALTLPLIFALPIPVWTAILNVNAADPGCTDSTGDAYCTIQAAIDDANHDEGRLQKTVRAAIAEHERAKITEGLKRGKGGKARWGAFVPPGEYFLHILSDCSFREAIAANRGFESRGEYLKGRLLCDEIELTH